MARDEAAGKDLPYTLRSIATLSGHEDRAWSVAWNPAKALLSTCSADKTVRIYSYADLAEPTFSLLVSIPTGHTKTVRSVAWSPSGTSLATGSFDSNIGIFQRENDSEGESGRGEWECVSMLEGHETECKCVAWSAGGNLLASCSRDKTVWVWEVLPDADFECMGVLMEHSQDVKCVAWHPSEEILASASYDDTVKLYLDDPAEDWFCFATLTGHTSTVWSIAWSPNGRYLASASDDRTIRLWKRIEEHKWVCVKAIEDAHERTIYSISWGLKPGAMGDRELGWLASAGGDGRINIWELEDEGSATTSTPPKHRLLARLEAAHGVSDVNNVVWCSRNGHTDLLASVGDDGETNIWKIVPISG